MPSPRVTPPLTKPSARSDNEAASVESLDFTRRAVRARAMREQAGSSASQGGEGARYSAPALEKGLDILEALADAPQGYSLNELAKTLGRSMGEIFRMAVTLEARGWVFVTQGDRYVLSLHMFELANRHRPMNALISAALPLMQRYSQLALQSCHLTLPENGRLLVVTHVDAPGIWSFGMRTGAVVSFYNSASGLVLLAPRNAEQRAQMLRRQDETAVLETPPPRFDDLLEQVRRQGFARVPSSRLKGITDIGFPIHGRHGMPIGALVSPFLERIDGAAVPGLEQALTELGRSARQLSQALGYTGPSLGVAFTAAAIQDKTSEA